jgi:hypothetical protein
MVGRWTVTAALVVLLAGAVGLQIARERLEPLPLPETDGAIMYVRSPEAIRRVALTYDGLAADLYWIRAIQHYGGTKRSAEPNKAYDQLYPLLDLTTSLDPRFNIAYRFGAIFLSEPYPNGPGRPDQAIALLRKGLEAQPTRWEFAQDIGFVHYWWLRDYKAAAEWFLRGSEMGGPNWLKPLAAVTLAQGGNRASSRQLWEQVLAGADVDWLRRQATMRLQQLAAMDHLDLLRRAAGAYEQRTGVALRSWQQLIASGVVRRVPVDPLGFQYELDGSRGTIRLNSQSPLNPLPVELLSIDQVPQPK